MMMQVIKSINEENLSKFCNTKKKLKLNNIDLDTAETLGSK